MVKFVDVIRADASDIHSPMQSLPLLYSSVGRGGREKHELAASQALNSSSIGARAVSRNVPTPHSPPPRASSSTVAAVFIECSTTPLLVHLQAPPSQHAHPVAPLRVTSRLYVTRPFARCAEIAVPHLRATYERKRMNEQTKRK